MWCTGALVPAEYLNVLFVRRRLEEVLVNIFLKEEGLSTPLVPTQF